MTDEMKLLRAFIEASGYEVEEVNNGKSEIVKAFWDRPAIIKEGIDYKVTKKPNPLHVYYDDVQLEQLVANIIQLSEYKADEKWIKYPKDSFDAVIDWFGTQANKQSDTLAEILEVDVFLLVDEDKK